MPAANFVFLSAADKLRVLENQFADLIAAELTGWDVTRTIGERRPKAVNMTFWMTRRAQIFMSHGVADKNYMLRRDKGEPLIKRFRHICVPGPWMKRKLLGVPELELTPDRVHAVGWPRLAGLLAAQEAYDASREQAGPGGRKPVVLWAPTHDGRLVNGNPTSSYPALEAFVPQLQELCDLRISLHPNNRGGGKPTFEHLVESDIVISDMGTLVYEAWALGKPVIFPDWICRQGILASLRGSAEAEIFRKGYGMHAESFDELVNFIRSPVPVRGATAAFAEDYLPEATYRDSAMRVGGVFRRVRADRRKVLLTRRAAKAVIAPDPA